MNPNVFNSLDRRGWFAARALIFAVAVLLVFALASICALGSPNVRVMVLNWKLGGMKPADYSTDVANLISEGRFDEAEKLASYIARNSFMPGQETVRDLMDEMAAKKSKRDKSPLKMGLELVTGFLSGGGESREELFGGLMSNILLSNKGLSKSDIPARADDESEEIASALEGANLGLSGKWYPGFIRTLHRSDLLSEEFTAFLKDNAAESAAAGKPSAELLEAVDGSKDIITEFGVERALGMFPEVRDAGDLTWIVKWGKSCPDETYLVVTHGGIMLLRKLPDTTEGAARMATIAQRGDAAIASANFWLK
ncbi:MAG: hypothetical protein LBS45_02485 [Synergistaceae bacterium]|jgi:hypothetical protein|nr:hypothetical protein [Synergistaceae bacterium]